MTRAIATAVKDSIIVSGPTVESVRAEIHSLMGCVGENFASFTMPVADANGCYLSIGHVQLSAPEEMS